MKITFLYQYFGTPAGSWSTRVYELTRRWVDAGHEVTIITAPYPKSDISSSKFIEHRVYEGIKVIIINSGDNNLLPKGKRVLKALIFAFTASFYHLKTKCDICIASSGPITIGIPALIGKCILQKPYVFEIRDLWPSGAIELGLIRSKYISWLGKKFEKMCYSHSNYLIPCSDGMRDDIGERYPLARSLVIPNACDIEFFDQEIEFQFPEWYDPKKKHFIYTGSIGLMDACLEIVYGTYELEFKEDIQIVIIGRGSEENLVKAEISRLGLDNYIKVLPLMPKKYLIAWYKIAYASFVLFKDYKILSTSSPNKMFDSFAAGIPIIQNTNGWIKNLVMQSNCGLNVLSNNPKEMAKAITFLTKNNDKRNEMALKSKELAISHFSRNKLAELYIQKLIEIVSIK